MSQQSSTTKTFQEKIYAQLQDAKAQIEKIEAAAKGKMAQAEVDAIDGLKTKRQEIEKKHQELKTSAETKAAQLKSEIETEMAKFKGSLEQFNAKFKGHSATK